MIQLIKNVKVYRDSAWRASEILISGQSIEKIADRIDISYEGMKVLDGEGRHAIPGYIDQHVHVTGGGGEGSFSTQVPPLKASAPVKAGVTTLVGLLGTDGTTRSVANLVAKTKALNEFGLTAFCLTGNYNYPSPTLTGSVLDDMVFIQECIGVKIAISDHRSANMPKEALIKLGSDARVAGLLAGKAGIVTLHTGTGAAKLSMLFDIVENTDIPITVFRPTHLNRHYEEAVRWGKAGGYADFTCANNGGLDRAQLVADALEEIPDRITFSTDANGSMPIWNEKKEMIGMGAGRIDNLSKTVANMVKELNVPLEKAIRPVTENVAKALNLYPKKGVLQDNADADIVLLDKDFMPDTVFVKGVLMMDKKEMQVHTYFEDI